MLTRDQMKANIEAMEKQGASRVEVQEWLDSLKKESAPQKAAGSGLLSAGSVEAKDDSWWMKTAKNVLPSAGKALGDIATAITHPIETVKGVGNLAKGLAIKAMPGEAPESESVDVANSVIGHYKERYGSLEKAAQTFQEDPVGFLMDASTFISGGAAIIGKAAKVSGLSKVANVAKVVSETAASADPLSMAGKAVSKGAMNIGENIFKVTPDLKAADAAKRAGVDLTASGLTKSRVVPVLEAFSEKSILGGEGMGTRVAKAKQQIQEFADNLKATAGPDGDSATVGMELVKAKDNFHDNWIATKNKLYEGTQIDPNLTIDPIATKAFVNSVLSKRKAAGEIIGNASKEDPFANILEGLTKTIYEQKQVGVDYAGRPLMSKIKTEAPPKLRSFKEAITQLNEKIATSTDPVITGNKATLKRLVATMSEDLDTAYKTADPEAYAKLQEANKYYKEGIGVLDSNIGNTIEAYRTTPSKIVEKLASPATPIEDIPRITELLGEEALPKIRKAVITDIIDSAKSMSTEGGDFMPAGIKRGMEKYGEEKLAAILTPKQVSALKDIDTVVKAINKTDKIVGGSQTAFLSKISAMSTAFVVNPLLGISMLVGDTAAAKWIASDVGQSVLSKGYTSKMPGFEKLPMKGGKIDVPAALKIMREAARQSGSVMNDESSIENP